MKNTLKSISGLANDAAVGFRCGSTLRVGIAIGTHDAERRATLNANTDGGASGHLTNYAARLPIARSADEELFGSRVLMELS